MSIAPLNLPPHISVDGMVAGDKILVSNNESSYVTIAENPNVGDIKVCTDSEKILNYSGDRWIEVGNWNEANWQTFYYAFKVNGIDDNIGIWSGSLDQHNLPKTWTLHTDNHFYDLDATVITKEDYETMIAFEAIPVVGIERESLAGILLKLPE